MSENRNLWIFDKLRGPEYWGQMSLALCWVCQRPYHNALITKTYSSLLKSVQLIVIYLVSGLGWATLQFPSPAESHLLPSGFSLISFAKRQVPPFLCLEGGIVAPIISTFKTFRRPLLRIKTWRPLQARTNSRYKMYQGVLVSV